MQRAQLVLAGLLSSVSLCWSCGGGASSPPAATREPTQTPFATAPPPPTCGAGTRPVAVDSSCAPVGVAAAPDGFVMNNDGWGFHPILPSGPCTGATIAVIGRETCSAIDACDAPFPGEDATFLVTMRSPSPSGAPSAGAFSRVFTTLEEALNAAPSGATVAVDEGEYALPDRFQKSVRLVGRCVSRTALRGSGFGVRVDSPIRVTLEHLALSGAPKVALLVSGRGSVSLNRVYVRGEGSGANVGNGATLNINDSVLDGPDHGLNPGAPPAGLYASYGGIAKLNGTEIRGYVVALMAQSKDTRVDVSRSVFHGQQAGDIEQEAMSIFAAFLGAKVTFDQSHIESGPGRILMIGAERLDGTSDPTSPGDPPAAVTVSNSTLTQGTIPRKTSEAVGTLDGATLELSNVTVRHQSVVGLSAWGAAITSHRSVVLTETTSKVVGQGFAADSGGHVVLDQTAIVGSTQAAITVKGASSVMITRSLITGNREVDSSEVTKFVGAGQAVSVDSGGNAVIRDSAFVKNQGTALFLGGGRAELDGVVVFDTGAAALRSLHAGVVGIDGVLAARGCFFARNGLAIALRGGKALIATSTITSHDEAFRLDGTAYLESTDPAASMVDNTLVTSQTTLIDNTLNVANRPVADE